MPRVLLLNGPNLNLLGTREPQVYGTATLAEIEKRCIELGRSLGLEVEAFQSNAEHELIGRIQRAPSEGTGCIVINPGGLTHTSVALRDAFAAVAVPFIELHISNTQAREPFRHHSFLSAIASGVIMGFGPLGYELAIRAAAHRLT